MALISNKKTFVIAEMANSHEGSLLKAREIVNAAYKAKADAIKFQKFYASELLEKNHKQFDHFECLEMNAKEWKNLIEYSKNRNLKIFVDVFGTKSAREISKFNIDGYKIHSTDITNPNLLKFFAKQNSPILLSTAGCTINEVDEAIKFLISTKKEIILMHGFQGFPTKIEDLNLKRIYELKRKFNLPVGLMDHISGDSPLALTIPLLGLSLGASVIEKHITLNRQKKGIDYYSALNPAEFKKMISLIRLSEKSFGLSNFDLSPNELHYRHIQKKNAISKNKLRKNSKLSYSLFEFKRTNSKKESLPYFQFKGKFLSKDIPKNSLLLPNMIKNKNNHIAAVIACRVGSDRLFAKPIQNIGKITILEFLLSQIKTSKLIDDVILAISEKPGNEIFIDFAQKNGIKFVVGDDNDVLHRLIIGAKFVSANIVFRVTSENPFIFWEGIDVLIKQHIEKNYDFSYFDNLPIGSSYEIINLSALEASYNNGSKRHRSELCSLYIYEHKKDFKIHKATPPKLLHFPNIRLNIDTPQDLIVAKIIYKSIVKKNKPVKLENVLDFLKIHPEILEINNSVPLGVTRIWN